MAPLYFELLTGLQILRSQQLESILAEKKQISSEDAKWLDGPANLTEETILLEKLGEATDDYEEAFEDLSLSEKTVAEKLWKFKQAANKVMWRSFAKLAGIPEEDWLALSEGWLTRFKGSMGMKNFKRHGEAALADPTAVAKE
ncbi:hypothetical protein HWV62_40758 [Athelia sp. TMB]|nr:hypothetical protein HWV62_40758 [Athelia sp. TMB]